jgi:hypothetical protein
MVEAAMTTVLLYQPAFPQLFKFAGFTVIEIMI